ncbi:hypothetical protein JDV02_006912 [Purpureocillium takamizusanense]|uniref:Uncharacterized protein n=1 Tax=Purpureocillium takamizusanense TaxID=2060973 RepID=A0A9Q8QJ94_9HYPO|nr:uncharacterized protein JDV02_006912 [Purpureocillium takamizusanense]UNI20863.1 hypothetical protein JDV02_006912 [Purpureocillium takamizusanense]
MQGQRIALCHFATECQPDLIMSSSIRPSFCRSIKQAASGQQPCLDLAQRSSYIYGAQNTGTLQVQEACRHRPQTPFYPSRPPNGSGAGYGDAHWSHAREPITAVKIFILLPVLSRQEARR